MRNKSVFLLGLMKLQPVSDEERATFESISDAYFDSLDAEDKQDRSII